jgi:hypothetical protein
MAPEKPIREQIKEIREFVEASKAMPPQKFNFPKGWKRKMNKSLKLKPNMIMVWMLNMKGEWNDPLLCPIVGGDIIVYNLKAYHINPAMITKFGKYRAYVSREIDKELVPSNGEPSETRDYSEINPDEDAIEAIANDDYDEVVKQGRGTQNHPTILKAVLAARQEAIKPKAKVNVKMILIILGVLVVGGIILASVLSKKPPV